MDLSVAPRLRAIRPGVITVSRMTNAGEVEGQIATRDYESTNGSLVWDEPFTICDIQFDDPKVGILTLAAVTIFAEFCCIFRVLCL